MMRGPALMFIAWTLHDAEEALTFPATANQLAELTGIDALRMSTRQSLAAIGLVGAVVAGAGIRGAQTKGESPLYRYAVAGLEAHVFTHLLSSAVLRRYTAGVITAVPIMLPGAALARRELAALGRPLTAADWRGGSALMAAVAAAAHLAVRTDWSVGFRNRRSRRRPLRGCEASAGAGA
ncbi:MULTISPECIES: HXXEE domain-containing protein [unclassified Brevibacterium]|uniref:HXXEE domain-containing protein n=1 Tax=unclassified Brevibacterium TaxID=2614124 RepID=UPI0010806E48|nr:HXXEE domain-containing protein [Brevibacterium sp. S111]TGD12500.1 HXXEE domain-containing protein [Brevibacterium sp. S111]